MNRHQKRRAARVARRDPKNKDAKTLNERSRFETELGRALECEGMKLIATSAGTDEEKKEPVWVFTIHATIDGKGHFVNVRSSRGTIADIATGVVETVRRSIAAQGTVGIELTKTEPLVAAVRALSAELEQPPTPPEATPPPPRELTLGEKIDRGLV